MANLGPVLTEWRRQVLLRLSKRLIMLPEPMRSVSVSRRSVRQECLDHLLILHEKQLQRVLNRYVAYFNRARPHQGIMQQIPEPKMGPLSPDHDCGKVISFSVLGGLHHHYQRVA